MGHELESELRKTQGRSLDGVVARMEHQEDHYTAIGTAPSMSIVCACDGSVSLDSTSTDVAGRYTFSDTWDNGDTVTLTWNETFNTAPVVLYSSWATNASGESLNEIDAYHSSTSGSILVCSGTCTKSVEYICVESI